MRNRLATKLVLLVGAVALTVGLMSVSAHALPFTLGPSNADGSSIAGLTQVYMQTAVTLLPPSLGTESGSFANSYSTAIVNALGVGSFALTHSILDSGAPLTCPLCVLLLNTDRGLFASGTTNLTFSLNGWNGTDAILGSGFNSINYLQIYAGNNGASVPEPASLLLLGAGLAGIGIWRRRSSKI